MDGTEEATDAKGDANGDDATGVCDEGGKRNGADGTKDGGECRTEAVARSEVDDGDGRGCNDNCDVDNDVETTNKEEFQDKITEPR